MIVLVDTSVFLNIIDLPGYNQDRSAVLQQFKKYVDDDASLLLPLVVFFEAGNHIGHLKNGDTRRQWALKLIDVAKQTIDEQVAPWTATPFPSREQFLEMISGFETSAMANCGLGDHSIIHEARRLRLQYPRRTITIWSLDHALSAHG